MNIISKNWRKIKKNLEANLEDKINQYDTDQRLRAMPTYEELELLVSFFAELLDEHIDAIFLTAVDDEFLTGKRVLELTDTQRIARMTAEAFAPVSKMRRGDE